MPVKVSKEFCSFCGDRVEEKCLSTCKACQAKMCQQTVRSGPGCIEFNTLKPDQDFLCLVCDEKRSRRLGGQGKTLAPVRLPHYNGALGLKRAAVLQYEFRGYSGRRHSKLNWPLVLVTVESKSEFGAIRETLNLDMKNQYLPNKENVRNIP